MTVFILSQNINEAAGALTPGERRVLSHHLWYILTVLRSLSAMRSRLHIRRTVQFRPELQKWIGSEAFLWEYAKKVSGNAFQNYEDFEQSAQTIWRGTFVPPNWMKHGFCMRQEITLAQRLHDIYRLSKKIRGSGNVNGTELFDFCQQTLGFTDIQHLSSLNSQRVRRLVNYLYRSPYSEFNRNNRHGSRYLSTMNGLHWDRPIRPVRTMPVRAQVNYLDQHRVEQDRADQQSSRNR